MSGRERNVLDWIVKLLPLALVIIATIGFAIRAEGRIDSTINAQLANERRFERIETAITGLQAAASSNAATVSNLVSLVARDQQDIARLNQIADSNRQAVNEIKVDVREIKTIVQRLEKQ